MYREFTQNDNEMEAKKSLIDAFIELGKCEPDSLEYKVHWRKINSVEKELKLIKYT